MSVTEAAGNPGPTGNIGPTRRELLTRGAVLAAAVGAPIPFIDNLAEGLVPAAMAQTPGAAPEGKAGLTMLGDRPLNLETPPTLLDPDVTPAKYFFVRNNGNPPQLSNITDQSWKLKIDGEVNRALDLSIADLKRNFETVSRRLVIECAGNGRKFHEPATSGNQWTFGGVGCAVWTGVRLADVLKMAGVKPSAVYTGHYGADTHLSGDPAKNAISRGVPIAKALDENNLIVWAMNGNPIPPVHGFPLRLIVPGWPGSCSQKWLTRIWIRDQVHDGEKMTGGAYRLPAYPVAPGTEVPDEDMVIIESMPVKSLITSPATGAKFARGEPIDVRGHAWSGDVDVARVDVSMDFGRTWQPAALDPLPNRYSWRRFKAQVKPPVAGYYEIWARATDKNGVSQPPVTPGWNPEGYNNNVQHRVAVFAL